MGRKGQMKKYNLIAGQSGGPTAVINSSLYGIISEALSRPDAIGHIYGMVNGIQGLLEDHCCNLGEMLSGADLEGLKYTPGAYLGSCRYKLPEDLKDPVYPYLLKKLEDMGIGYFLYIGGNDSMDTVSKLSRYAAVVNSGIRFLGEPKTIDNDLVLTDHTPGFGSAARFVATAVREITADAQAYDAQSVTIVEIMGRNAGWLTGAGVLARRFKNDNPLLIYLPEVPFCREDFLKRLADLLKTHKTVIVCVSEGLHDAEGRFLCEDETGARRDIFGHQMLNGCAKLLAHLVRRELGVKVRSVELNVIQRCSSGLLSQTDRDEAVMAGRYGVKAVLGQETGRMVAFERESNSPYRISCSLKDVAQICNKEKRVPLKWIREGCDLTEDFVRYAAPLIKGTVAAPMEGGGLPAFVYRKET